MPRIFPDAAAENRVIQVNAKYNGIGFIALISSTFFARFALQWRFAMLPALPLRFRRSRAGGNPSHAGFSRSGTAGFPPARE